MPCEMVSFRWRRVRKTPKGFSWPGISEVLKLTEPGHALGMTCVSRPPAHPEFFSGLLAQHGRVRHEV